jgi:acetyl-CoA carboxylase biotin carboxyl carrier protein
MTTINAHITGTVWSWECAVGDRIDVGDIVAILESMKMEMPVEAEVAGVITKLLCEEGESVVEGQALADIDA